MVERAGDRPLTSSAWGTGGSPAGDERCRRVQLIRRATSFGAVESTFERGVAVAGQEHLPPGLPRLRVGLDHVEDLWNDMTRAI